MELTIESPYVVLGGRVVLDSIAADLAPGRVIAILGPNGAGKSTLLKAMAGLIVPQGGSILLGGRDVTRIDPRERGRLIGYLPQDAVVHWDVHAADIVALGRLPYHSPFAGPSPEDFDAIVNAMQATDTTALGDRPIKQLSGGERARVLLARVLAGAPQWLLADEPLASLDPAHQIDMLDRLRDVARAGRGVAIVLHDLSHAARIADDVLLLDAGRLVAYGPTLDTLTPAPIAQVFGIDACWVETAGKRLLVPLGRTT